ncbi:MAG: hypothetical protein R3190_09005 [Thermoanaerobaculia bacterium]|nr:hypothetical protein [Thermoanaerobaculia bacterium]
MPSRLWQRFAIAAAATILAIPAGAAEEDNRWFVRLDSFLPMNQETRVRYDTPLQGVGIDFRLEDEPGLDDNYSQFRLAIGRRIGAKQRHEIELSYLETSRDNTTTTTVNLQLGSVDIPLDAQLDTSADTTDLELNYKYYFLLTDTGELGVVAGIHILDFESIFAATISPQGGPIALPVRVRADVSAPIPVVGLKGDWNFASKWHLNGSLKAFDASIDDIDIKGSFVELQVAVEHYTFKHVGFGIGFFADRLDAEETAEDQFFLGEWDQDRDGGFVFVRGRF